METQDPGALTAGGKQDDGVTLARAASEAGRSEPESDLGGESDAAPAEHNARLAGDTEQTDEPEAEFVPTAPALPVEVMLKSFSWWIQRYPHGAIELKFAGTIIQPTPMGPTQQVVPPGYSIMFPNEEIWQRFQEHIAATEVPTGPAIETAPAGALDQLRQRRDADQAALRRTRR